MKYQIYEFLIIIFMTSSPYLFSQIGSFDSSNDIGMVKLPGSSVFNAPAREYIVEGSGSNIWFGEDEFHFLWKKLKGDFIVTATIEFIGNGVDPHRKTGWMIRQSHETGSSHISAVIHGDGLTSLQFRKEQNGNMEEIRSSVNAPDVVQLQRKGTSYIMSVAKSGDVFTEETMLGSFMTDDVYVGLFVCSHNADVKEKVIFRNVRITIPASDNFIPYSDYIGANLETLDVSTGNRQIILTSPLPLQAPNWTPDGKNIIYNCNGLLYNFDISTKKVTEINTGFATINNNDHVLSFDGKMIGISHHSAEDSNNSIIYILPVKGGAPEKVTSKGPSYLHGWSPDGKFLTYTGGRNQKYNIYKIPVSGGEEVQLTHSDSLDDGSEYTPDGRYIYFNSNRTGLMQIWRMKPDGSEQEQVTNDKFNNWFPHISPDGKWIVFLSYGQDVKSGDHPYYKQVYIRLMPISGGDSKVIAYLYGGQGTINVPSWSPDSKKIAFISNTDKIK